MDTSITYAEFASTARPATPAEMEAEGLTDLAAVEVQVLADCLHAWRTEQGVWATEALTLGYAESCHEGSYAEIVGILYEVYRQDLCVVCPICGGDCAGACGQPYVALSSLMLEEGQTLKCDCEAEYFDDDERCIDIPTGATAEVVETNWSRTNCEQLVHLRLADGTDIYGSCLPGDATSEWPITHFFTMSTLKATLTGEFEGLYWFDLASPATGRFVAACCLAPSDGPLPLEAAGGCYEDWITIHASSADLRSLFDLDDDDDDVREHLAEAVISACCESF